MVVRLVGGLVTDNCCFFFWGFRFPGWPDKCGHINRVLTQQSPSWSDALCRVFFFFFFFVGVINGNIFAPCQESPLIHSTLFPTGNARRSRNPWHARTQRCHSEYNAKALHWGSDVMIYIFYFIFLQLSFFFRVLQEIKVKRELLEPGWGRLVHITKDLKSVLLVISAYIHD